MREVYFRRKLKRCGASLIIGYNCSVGRPENISIGDNVGISNGVIIGAQKEIVIEDNALIAFNCVILDSERNFNILDKPIREQGFTQRRTHIKRNAWIGANSIILSGRTIGENAIVGAGSVVTKDIPDCEIWAGNPAKFIRKRCMDEGG